MYKWCGLYKYLYSILLILFERMGNTFNSVSNPTNATNVTGSNQVIGSQSGFFGGGSSVPKGGYAEKANEHFALKGPASYTLNNINTVFGSPLATTYPVGEGQIYNIKKHNATYQGRFDKGNPSGKGVIHFHDGGYYSGDFVNGDANGRGIYIYPNGSVYEGNFVNSRFGGHGSLVYVDQRMRYDGNFVDGYPEGKGKETYYDGGFYDGNFHKGQKHGHGVYHWANGQTYEGNFEHGLMHGRGILKNNNEITYQGNFVRGTKAGHGVFKTADGTYQGNFENDLLNGDGTFIWNDGKIYEGQFRNSMMHGRGRMLYTTNQVAEGEWEKNHNKVLEAVRNDVGIKERINQIVGRHQASLRPGFESKNSYISERQSDIRGQNSGFLNKPSITDSYRSTGQNPVAYQQPKAVHEQPRAAQYA